MSAANSSAEDRLHFFKRLQLLTNKIHATQDIDDIMLELSLIHI